MSEDNPVNTIRLPKPNTCYKDIEKEWSFIDNSKNNWEDFTLETSQSLIVVGANGSGKSKFGAWVESSNEKVHRISALRNLTFKELIPIEGREEAQRKITTGQVDKPISDFEKNQGCIYKWNNGKTSKVIDDYDHTLAFLLADESNIALELRSKLKTLSNAERTNCDLGRTVFDNLKEIWNNIFPHRKIILKDQKIQVSISENIPSYSGHLMSDGERATLYIIVQALTAPEDYIVIVDEPELHLHRSIMNALWEKIESYRKDCKFIYITHDVDFASQHHNSKKIWIKNYDGQGWNWSEITNYNELPQELLLEVLGSRKNILFVEGNHNSPDIQLYSILFPNYKVIPCGSCTSVIERTKAFNRLSDMTWIRAIGIIDKDYRTDYEISKYELEKIFTLNVAEVENLFLIEPVLNCLQKHLNLETSPIENIKKEIKSRFQKEIKGQQKKAFIAQLKYELDSIDLNQLKDITELVEKSKKMYKEVENKINLAFDNVDTFEYNSILKIFNQKNLIKNMGHFFDIPNDKYILHCLRIFKSKPLNELRLLFKDYIAFEKIDSTNNNS